MQILIRRIIEILDATPTEFAPAPQGGNKWRGQAVTEMALITPILIVLLAGLIEIGWFANNYLTLLDVTRAGARRGTTLSGNLSPLFWNNGATLMPYDAVPVDYAMPYTATDPTALSVERDLRMRYRDSGAGYSGCSPQYLLFYNEVICTMLLSLEPLTLNGENAVDDIIVSGFSLQNVDASRNGSWLGPNRPESGNVPQVVVSGRYPINANECDVQEVPPGSGVFVSREPRDPFDIDENGRRSLVRSGDDFDELEGYDSVSANRLQAERQVGYVWFGNHQIPDSFCLGSEWTIARVEDLVNLPNFALSNNDQRSVLPTQGLILVEMYWQHELLLKIPVFNPVYSLLGDRTAIYVWAAFPLPSVEQPIIFP